MRLSCWQVFSIFVPSKMPSKFCFEKTSKKMRKSRILASQTPPKTLPKSYQNRGSKKHAIFHRFLLDVFLFFNLRFLENRGFPIGKSLILRFSLKSCFYKFNAFWVQKTYQKPFQNEVRTLPKSMPKTCYFSASIFFGFRPRFCRVLGLQVRRAACSARRVKSPSI